MRYLRTHLLIPPVTISKLSNPENGNKYFSMKDPTKTYLYAIDGGQLLVQTVIELDIRVALHLVTALPVPPGFPGDSRTN
jgi:hypothetical protein